MLVSLEGETTDVVAAAKRIHTHAGLSGNTPIIIFCVRELKDEFAVERRIYLSCPDDFNQLRDFIKRLLKRFPSVARI